MRFSLNPICHVLLDHILKSPLSHISYSLLTKTSISPETSRLFTHGLYLLPYINPLLVLMEIGFNPQAGILIYAVYCKVNMSIQHT